MAVRQVEAGRQAAPEFLRYPVKPSGHTSEIVVHGDDPLTIRYGDDLLWAINANRMKAAGHFVLAEIGCGAGCIRLAAIDTHTADTGDDQ